MTGVDGDDVTDSFPQVSPAARCMSKSRERLAYIRYPVGCGAQPAAKSLQVTLEQKGLAGLDPFGDHRAPTTHLTTTTNTEACEGTRLMNRESPCKEW